MVWRLACLCCWPLWRHTNTWSKTACCLPVLLKTTWMMGALVIFPSTVIHPWYKMIQKMEVNKSAFSGSRTNPFKKICQHRWNSQGDPPEPAVSQIFPRDPTVLQLPVHLPPTWAVLGVKHMWPDRKLRKIGLWPNYDMTSGYTVTVYHVICGIPL